LHWMVNRIHASFGPSAVRSTPSVGNKADLQWTGPLWSRPYHSYNAWTQGSGLLLNPGMTVQANFPLLQTFH
jgi:hypothetical protein